MSLFGLPRWIARTTASSRFDREAKDCLSGTSPVVETRHSRGAYVPPAKTKRTASMAMLKPNVTGTYPFAPCCITVRANCASFCPASTITGTTETSADNSLSASLASFVASIKDSKTRLGKAARRSRANSDTVEYATIRWKLASSRLLQMHAERNLDFQLRRFHRQIVRYLLKRDQH